MRKQYKKIKNTKKKLLKTEIKDLKNLKGRQYKIERNFI